MNQRRSSSADSRDADAIERKALVAAAGDQVADGALLFFVEATAGLDRLAVLHPAPRGTSDEEERRQHPESGLTVVVFLRMIPWFTRFSRATYPSQVARARSNGACSKRCGRDGPAASVRDLRPEFPEIAYTTLMTTLDRLHRKGVLARTKQGRAFFYTPGAVARGVRSPRRPRTRCAPRSKTAARRSAPLLSCFVDAVGDRDRALLDELEALVRARRAEIEDKRS